MKTGKLFFFIFLLNFFLLSACQDDEEKKSDYSGISELISERNKTRHEIAKKNPMEKAGSTSIEKNISTPKQESDFKEEEISSIVLYEEKVEIIGAESRRPLAKGVASINKKGQIVKIQILKE